MGHLGYDRDGAFAEYFLQRADRVRPLPDELPTAIGALLEPVAVCLQAIARAGKLRGRDVMVAGDGPFGNIIARLASRTGAHRVFVVGREPFRLRQIRGAETATVAPNASFNVAILAVSSVEFASGYRNDLDQFARITSLELKKITAPTLVVQGSADSDVAPAYSAFAAASIPGAELLTLDTGTHLALFTHPAAAAAQARVVEFLRRR